MTVDVEPDHGLQGQYANVVTRFAAFVIDVLTAAAAFAIAGAVVERVLSVLLGRSITLGDGTLAARLALVAWLLVYAAYPLAVTGRTFGMSVLGLRAVRADGSDLGAVRAVVRVVAFPLSFLLVGLGFVLIVLRRDHRALHDLLAGSAVVYSWNARVAHLRFLMRQPGAISPP